MTRPASRWAAIAVSKWSAARSYQPASSAIRPACSTRAGLLGLVGAQLGGLQVGGLGRLRGADGLAPARPPST